MIHLHGHSHFSLFEGYGSPAKIVEKAKKLGFSAIGIADYSNMYGAIEFYEVAKKNDIKPIIGVEIPFALNEKVDKPNFLILIAKNYIGYKNLLEIVSEANLKYYQSFAKINFQILQKYKNDLIAIFGGPKSLLGNMILANEKEEKIIEILQRFENILGKENIILEFQVQPLPDYKKINKTLYNIAKKENYTLTISNNYHYINPEDKSVFGLMQAIKLNEYYNPAQHNPQEDFHIFSEEEIIEKGTEYLEIEKKEIENILSAQKEIADNIDIEIPLGNILFPKYQPSEKIKNIYKKYKNELIEK